MTAILLATAALWAGVALEDADFTLREDGSWTAASAVHGLQTTVDAEGFTVEPTGASAPAFRLAVRLTTWGRDTRSDVAAGRIRVQGSRAEIERDGLTEWVINEARGFEHGFTLQRRPDGTGPLVIGLAIGAAAVPAGDRAVVFHDAAGRPVVRYDGLAVADASGRDLPARLEVGLGALRIVIDDTGALWPLTVDPVLSSASAILPPGAQASALFGNSVSSAGDVNADGYADVLVSAYAYDAGTVDEGKVFLYLGGPGGLASSPAWSAQGTQTGAYFGVCARLVADVNGDGLGDILVGSHGYDNGNTDEGAVFLYLGNGTTFDASPAWSFESNQTGAQMGAKLAWAGDVNGDGVDDFLVAAPLFDVKSPFDPFAFDNGRVWVFHGTSGGLPVLARTLSGQSDEHFGGEVSIAGDVDADGYDDILVGSPNYDLSVTDQGRAQLFLGSAGGVAAAPAWSITGSGTSTLLGSVVGAAGDVNGDGYADVIVTEPGRGVSATAEGWWYVYAGQAGGLGSLPVFQGHSFQADARLGQSALAAGDVNGDGFSDVIFGTTYWDGPGGGDAGRAEVYLGNRVTGVMRFGWVLHGEQAAAYLGDAVAPAGDVNGDGYADVVIGALGHDVGAPETGKAYVAYGGADLPAPGDQVLDSPGASAEFGRSVSSAGDVNGDGYYDFLVGSPAIDTTPTAPGLVQLFLGQSSGFFVEGWSQTGTAAGLQHLGRTVGTVGDWNGDGLSDAAVSGFDPVNGQGIVRLYRGSATAPYLVHEASFASGSGDFGISVSGGGDLDGDGYGDFVVGDPGGFGGSGRADLFYGAPTTAGLDRRVFSGSGGYGRGVAIVGDLDADGHDDLAVGAPEAYDFPVKEGWVHLYYGTSFRLVLDGGAVQSEDFNALMGTSVSAAGDVNGDGYADLAAGAYGDGRLYVFYGGPLGGSTVVAHPDRAVSAFGWSVSSAGDVNNDGYGDVMVGAPEYESGVGALDRGAAYLHLGSPTGLNTTAARSWFGPDINDARLGESVAGAFDADGDGYGEVLVGSRYDDATHRGRVDVYHGNGGTARTRATRQEGYGFAPPNHMAIANTNPDPYRFYAHARVFSPSGRSWIEVETQSAAVSQSGWTPTGFFLTDTGLGSSGAIDAQVYNAGLVPDTVHRWRYRIESAHPWFARSPWFSMPDNTVTLGDFRTHCLLLTWYSDSDADGYGNGLGGSMLSCTSPGPGWAPNAEDCDDTSAAVHPGASEICNATDDDCDTLVDEVPPGAPPRLEMTRTAGTTSVTWDALAGETVDVVRGGLSALLSTGGDFSSSVLGCLTNDNAGSSVAEPALPSLGDGFYYVGRRVGCGAIAGTYDESPGSGQQGSRDAEIAASGGACP